MQSNNSIPSFNNFNGNSTFNILQQHQQQQQQQNLNVNHINLSASNLLQHQQQQENIQKQTDTTFTKIFVGGLPYHTTDESLKIFFQKFGNIEEAVVINDRQTGKSRGYGFVTMETKEAAEAAIYDPNPIIDGRKANVNLAYLGVKSRTTMAPSGLIPLTIRYQLPATSNYGFHPFYYHHPNGSTNVHQAQPTFTNTFLASTPNLLISAQNAQSQIQSATTTISPNKTALLNSTYDLTTAYTTSNNNNNSMNHVTNGLNLNRTSPFETSTTHLTAGLAPNTTFLQSFNSSNNGALNSILNSSQSNGNFFTLQNPFSNPFQSQLQDRL